MILRANGKRIDTLPIRHLLSQEEHFADTIVFEVARFYNGMDLSAFTYTIRGVTEGGGETQAPLTMEVHDEVLHLRWQVSDQFTAEGGTLRLDLFAVCYDSPEADPAAEAPDHVLRYQLPPIEICARPDSEGGLEGQSYTAFLLEVKAAAEDGIAAMNAISDEFDAKASSYDATLTVLDKRVISLAARVTENETAIAAATPVVVLTQEEYDALEEPDAGTVYVICEPEA